MKQFFITATGTESGKTLVMTSLCAQLRAAHRPFTALKPVVSGYDDRDTGSDTALILRACELPFNAQYIQATSPWRFAAPLAPSMAAAQEGRTLDMQEIARFCRMPTTEVVLAEGAGGVMAPLTQKHTMLDLMAELGWPVILVAGNYLGSLSHTLTAVGALEGRGLKVQAIVLSEATDHGVPLADTKAELQRFIDSEIPIAVIPRIAARSEMWQYTPSLITLLERE